MRNKYKGARHFVRLRVVNLSNWINQLIQFIWLSRTAVHSWIHRNAFCIIQLQIHWKWINIFLKHHYQWLHFHKYSLYLANYLLGICFYMTMVNYVIKYKENDELGIFLTKCLIRKFHDITMDSDSLQYFANCH